MSRDRQTRALWMIIGGVVATIAWGVAHERHDREPTPAPECTPTARVLDRGLEIGSRAFLRSKERLDHE